jgi:hypothetical protein
MNRRNFFSLILGAPIAAALGIKPRTLEAQFQADLDAWIEKYRHLTSGHSHAISDPGHTHSLSDPTHNPNWIPARGQWVTIDGADYRITKIVESPGCTEITRTFKLI